MFRRTYYLQIAKGMSLSKRFYSNHTNNGKTNKKNHESSFNPFWRLLMLDKRRFFSLIFLSVLHSSMFMIIPFAFKEIQR